ncbi:MAG TPA: hypothetical protein VFZ04_02955, partial [Longimicrobiales bacterium]
HAQLGRCSDGTRFIMTARQHQQQMKAGRDTDGFESRQVRVQRLIQHVAPPAVERARLAQMAIQLARLEELGQRQLVLLSGGRGDTRMVRCRTARWVS